MRAHFHVGVHLLLQLPDLRNVLPHGLLQVQDTAALLLRVAGDFQLEAHPLFLLAVLLDRGTGKVRVALGAARDMVTKSLVSTLRLGSTCSSRLLTMSRIMAYCAGLVEISRSWWISVNVSTAPAWTCKGQVGPQRGQKWDACGGAARDGEGWGVKPRCLHWLQQPQHVQHYLVHGHGAGEPSYMHPSDLSGARTDRPWT